MLKKLVDLLRREKVKFKRIEHRKVFTAFDAAATQHIDLKTVGKTLLVKSNGKFALAVLAGNKKLDVVKLKKVMNAHIDELGIKEIKKLTIASEEQIKRNITKKTGAVPPFGSLYLLPTIVDLGLMKQKKINLNAGSFTESIEMTPAQYKKAEVKMIVGNIGK